MTNSTFYNNSASGSSDANGGGLAIEHALNGTASASTTLVNDTFFQNNAQGSGGGLYLAQTNNGTGACSAWLYSLTVYYNWAMLSAGGAYASGPNGSLTLDNNIFEGNDVYYPGYTSPLDILFSNPKVINTEKYNLVGTSDKGFTGTGDINDALNYPGLAGSLANNGAAPGYPQTLALSNISPGYEKGDQNLVNLINPYTIDERGWTRQAGKVSMGAEDPDAM